VSGRLDYAAADPELVRAMFTLHRAIDGAGLERSLLHLVKFRASQINGCVHCIDLHAREAVAEGETEKRLHLVAVWRETPVFTPREKAALAWTEAMTCLGEAARDDALYAATRAEFSEAEMVKLTGLIGMINFWNRMSIGFATPHSN